MTKARRWKSESETLEVQRCTGREVGNLAAFARGFWQPLCAQEGGVVCAQEFLACILACAAPGLHIINLDVHLATCLDKLFFGRCVMWLQESADSTAGNPS